MDNSGAKMTLLKNVNTPTIRGNCLCYYHNTTLQNNKWLPCNSPQKRSDIIKSLYLRSATNEPTINNYN